MELYPVLLQAASGDGGPQQWLTIVWMVGLFAVMYFFIIRPKQKEAKDKKQFIEELKKGDKVTIFGGIHGKITSLKESTAIVQIDDQTKITVEKGALQAIPPAE